VIFETIVHVFKFQTLQNPLRFASGTLYRGSFADEQTLKKGPLVCGRAKPFYNGGFVFQSG
jgi:hypothetical protein